MLESSEVASPRIQEVIGVSSSPLLDIDVILARHSMVVLPSARQELRSLQRDLKRELDWPGPQVGIPFEIAQRFKWGNEDMDELLQDFGNKGGFTGLEIRRKALGTSSTNPQNYRRIKGLSTSIPGLRLNLAYGVHEPRWYLQAEINQVLAAAIVLAPRLSGLPHWEYMRSALLNYYDAIDKGDIQSALSLFANDNDGGPVVRYKRGTGSEIVGFENLIHFFEEDRITEKGTHTLEELDLNDRSGTGRVKGKFKGTLKNGRDVNVAFHDRFEFLSDKVIYRRSSFPGEEV